MSAKTHQEDVFNLAQRIADLLIAHPNPYEAEAACGMAKELAKCRAEQWPFMAKEHRT